MTHNDEDAGGHYVVSGAALAGLGVFALLVALVVRLLHVELLYIDARAMSVIGAGFFFIGGGMTLHGLALARKP